MEDKDLTELSDEELEEAATANAQDLEYSREQAKKFARELERRVELKNARKKIGSLSDSERAALAQVFKAEGIESREAVMTGEDEQ